MDDFFETVSEHWPASREDYHWHVLPGSELLRERLVRPYLQLIEQPGLVPTQPSFLHMTIQHLAPVSEITRSELDRTVALVRNRCADMAPFAVTAARAQAWEHGIVCPITPGFLLTELWRLTTTAYQEATDRKFPVRPPVFHPHLALAYAIRHLDTAPVRAWLADSDAPEVPIPVTKLVLVAQQHNNHEITFRVIDEVQLSG